MVVLLIKIQAECVCVIGGGGQGGLVGDGFEASSLLCVDDS